jgi:hypothetical protein
MSFWMEILYFAGRSELDTMDLKSHLMAAGLAAAITGVEQPTLYDLWPFAGPTADAAAARVGLEQLLGRFLERELEAEVRKVEPEVLISEGEAPDETQARLQLQGLQQQLRQSGLRGTTLDNDGFGEASGTGH